MALALVEIYVPFFYLGFSLSFSLTQHDTPTGCVLNHKSVSVNSNRIARFEASASLIVGRCESLSRGIMRPAKYCFRLEYHGDRSPEKQDLPSTTYSRLHRTEASMINETRMRIVQESAIRYLRLLLVSITIYKFPS